jgi:hypothetical protein
MRSRLPVRRFTTFILILLVLFCVAAQGSSAPIPGGRPWFTKFVPLRQLYVSVTGGGSGSSSTSPMTLNQAISSVKPGDLVWLQPGTYVGDYVLRKKGNENHPIVFRAQPGTRVQINGVISVDGAHTWIWGLEVTDPTGRVDAPYDSCLRANAPGVRLINNVIHDPSTNKNTVTAWNRGPQVIYGNIIYNGRHNLYTQNDFSRYGYKYIVGNVIFDPLREVSSNAQNIQAYTEGNLVSGFYLTKNIFSNGRVLLGGYGKPADQEVVIENYIYLSPLQFGYQRPSQAKCIGNYLGRSTLLIQWFWGGGEIQYHQSAPNIFTNNEIIKPVGAHIAFRTSAYLPAGRCEGCSPIRAGDVFNNNTYSNPFRASFYANSRSLGGLNFGRWKAATAAAGNPFDVNSRTVPQPKGPKIVLIRNDYEPSRYHLAIFNWKKNQNVTVDFSTAMPAGANFQVYPIRSVFGSPVVTATNTAPVSIPTSGQEFSMFLVLQR